MKQWEENVLKAPGAAERVDSIAAELREAAGGKPPQHNHLTRDIKPPGECPRCDAYHQYQARQAEEAPRYYYRRWRDVRERLRSRAQ